MSIVVVVDFVVVVVVLCGCTVVVGVFVGVFIRAFVPTCPNLEQCCSVCD